MKSVVPFIILLVFIVLGTELSDGRENQKLRNTEQVNCQAKGGVYVKTQDRNVSLCFNKDALLINIGVSLL